VFDNEATGIKSVVGPEAKAEGVYNLSGQRVSQPTKGIYIVNGKKTIMKYRKGGQKKEKDISKPRNNHRKGTDNHDDCCFRRNVWKECHR